MSFSSHSEVIGAFGRHFAGPERMPRFLHGYLKDAQEARRTGDYGQRGAVSEELAREQIEHAEEFLREAERLLGPLEE